MSSVNLYQYLYQPSGEYYLTGSSGSGSVSYSYLSSANAGGAVSAEGGAASAASVANQVVSDLLALNNASGGAGGAGSVSSVSVSGGYGLSGAGGYGLAGAGGYGLAGSGALGAAGGAGGFLESSAFSHIEQAILSARNPIDINENEIITVNGQSGIWSNKNEVLNWRGVIPITQYLINEDSSPEVIRKRTEQQLLYEQEIAIRYLRPPTPPPPGEIIIRQEKNILTPPAPPLVIRQQPPRPETPAPLVIREAPPRPPAAVGQKVVTISGKRLPPPPRKVVIERLAPLPSKPQSVIIERWLPYRDQRRRVIFQRQLEADPVIPRPRNVIVQWEAPSVVIKKEFRDLGVIRANPSEYVSRYGGSLKSSGELPDFVREIRPPVGLTLASEHISNNLLELEGDVHALSLIDLDYNGLSEYKSYLRALGGGFYSSSSFGNSIAVGSSASSASSSLVNSSSNVSALVAELFAQVDVNADGFINRSEAEKLLLKLNSRLGRRYGEDEARLFFKALDVNNDGFIDFEEFRRALLRQF